MRPPYRPSSGTAGNESGHTTGGQYQQQQQQQQQQSEYYGQQQQQNYFNQGQHQQSYYAQPGGHYQQQPQPYVNQQQQPFAAHQQQSQQQPQYGAQPQYATQPQYGAQTNVPSFIPVNSPFEPASYPLAAQMGLQLGTQAISAGQEYVNKNLGRWFSPIRVYFQVSNGYVLNKLFLLIFPFRHHVRFFVIDVL